MICSADSLVPGDVILAGKLAWPILEVGASGGRDGDVQIILVLDHNGFSFTHHCPPSAALEVLDP
jgi:hypothetical protein